MKLLREYIRELLKEDPMGFVHDLAAASEEFGEEGEMFFGGDPGRGGAKAIKRAFNANADHQWLSTLDTVHWADIYALADLAGRGKDELSATMTLPGESFVPMGNSIGLWIKGRITLATNDMDQLYSGHWEDYKPGLTSDVSEEEYEQRKKSSGINKLPTISQDYSRYGKLQRGNEYHEQMARGIPYVLDQSTWEDVGATNEALVDNWKPVGLIADWEVIQMLKKMNKDQELDDFGSVHIGRLGRLRELAEALNVPIFDRERNELWSPK
jgi:hypothetical protein